MKIEDLTREELINELKKARKALAESEEVCESLEDSLMERIYYGH